MKKVIITLGLAGTLLLTGCSESKGYSSAQKVTRTETDEPTVFYVQNGDVLYRNGTQLRVFEDVQTGEYTITNGGNFELLRKGN